MERHDAFISYSRGDKAFAAALEKRLETFRAPKDLPVRQGYLDIFRDEHDFIGGEYFSSLTRHLEASATLIVICSPNARASEFVNDEIRRFADLRGADRIVPVLLAGVPNNEANPEREDEKAFPEALCDVLEMPLAANYLEFEVSKDRFDRGAYTDSWFTLLANVYQVSRSEIEQRERRRRARFVRSVIAVTGSIIAILIAALIVTLISRAEAVRQAIEARRQTATRLAVQALEKIDVAPETALQLAIDAVETYHRHGDPTVPRALEALHKVQLSFGGGRPVLPWRPDQADIVFSDNLVWAAASSKGGDVRFTRAGSGDVEVLDPPQVLEPGELWADYAPALVFTRGRLIAGRPVRDADARSPKQAALWYWPLTKDGISGPARPIGRYDQRYWNVFEPVASASGRWLSWYGGRDDLYVKDLSTDRAPVIFPSSDELRAIRSFSVDQTELLAATKAGLVVISLPSEDQTEAGGLPQVEQTLTTSSWELGHALGMAARSPDRRCRGDKDQTGLTQTAILNRNGDVTWWDLTQSPQVKHQLPNVFSAFSEQMQVWQLERKKVRARLEFSLCGRALLASVAERSGEFGIAAHIQLEKDADWQPVFVEQLKSQLTAGMSRISGDGGGIRRGYRLTDQKKLGTAQAMWFIENSLLTIGFDGSLEFHDTERQASQYLSGDAVQVAASYNFNEQGGISVGTRNGQVKIIGDEDSEPVFLMSAHDTPVSRLLQDRTARRIVAVNEKGGARIWETDNPIMRPDHFRGVSSDWKRFFNGKRRAVRSWDISASNPFRKPLGDVLKKEGKATDETADGAWAVSRETDANTNTLTLKLYRRGDGAPEESPDQGLTIEPPAGEADVNWRWNYRGWLHVDGEHALYLATGRNRSGDGALLVDLNEPSAAPVTVLEPNEDLKIESVAANLDKLLLTKGELRSKKSETALEVRGVASATGKPLFRIEGTRYGNMSGDGRWLVANDTLFDLGREPVTARATREGPHAWDYRVNFTTGRPPVWLDKAGNLWGVDPAPASTSDPQQLISDQSLTEIAWSPSTDWLGLGSADGRAWVVQLEADVTFTKIQDALKNVSSATALPAAWDKRTADEIERIELLPTAGWVKADTDKNFILLWRGTPEIGWSQPLVFHQMDGFRGAGSFTCQHDGDVCVVEGQLMNFDPAQLLPMAKGLLTGPPS